MKLALRSIIERGNIAKERLTLKVESDVDIGDYAVLQCRIFDGVLNTDVLRAFWFPYSPVLSGDLIVLYSKKGEPRSKLLSNGSKAHFFYWGFDESIWSADVAAVVLEAPNWISKPASQL